MVEAPANELAFVQSASAGQQLTWSVHFSSEPTAAILVPAWPLKQSEAFFEAFAEVAFVLSSVAAHFRAGAMELAVFPLARELRAVRREQGAFATRSFGGLRKSLISLRPEL